MEPTYDRRPDEEENTRRVGEWAALRPALQPASGRGPNVWPCGFSEFRMVGKPTLWINADHLVSVQPVARTGLIRWS